MINVDLKVIGGKHAGQKIPLDRKKFLIGREQDCQLRPNSELVSRHHCVFTVDDFAVRLRDLGSTNGTLVNGERIRKEVVLQQGDRVTVGSLDFVVSINERNEAGVATTKAPNDNTVVASDTLAEITPVRAGEGVVAAASLSGQTPSGEFLPQQPPVPEPVPAGTGSSPALPVAQTPPPAPPQMPGMGDTTVISQPMLIPGQMPYQPMMPQQMGYPMYGNYPYPGIPQMYGQGYPQGYPQTMQMPGMPMAPPAAAAPAPEPAPAQAGSGAMPAISLPDPSTTGARVEPPKPPEPPKAEGAGGAAGKGEKSNESAGAIIKQFMQKRPGG
ncbi:MAG: FHA domain-containing protein [Planctomycetaceae bacterium]